MNLLTKQKETHRLRKWTYGCQGDRRGEGLWDGHVHTAIFEMDNQQDLLYSTRNCAHCYVPAWMGGRSGGEWTRVYIYMAGPLCCSLETTTRVLIGYAAAAESRQSCPTLCDPIDGNPPGSPLPGILQARTLEWVATSFSNAWKWKVKVKSLSRVQLLATPWTAAHQAPPSMGFSRQEYWSGVPLPSPLIGYIPIQNCFWY